MNKKERSILKENEVLYYLKRKRSIPTRNFGDAVFIYYYLEKKELASPLIFYDTEYGWEVLLNWNIPMTVGYHFMVEPMHYDSYMILHKYYSNNLWNGGYIDHYKVNDKNFCTAKEVYSYQDEMDRKWYDELEKEGCVE